ncbi:uncharacterized protein LOC131946148 [Physella acuta]|uniref:uncharacterized protein LOC131946148 n=1 Tax=Physella acuta TaxID=109671 RepID=UPI0027DD5A5B|nr:uncharacterized protein LOC131946148 [Physella acuta]
MDAEDHFKSELDATKSLIGTMNKHLQTQDKKLNELEKHAEEFDQKYGENSKILKLKFDKIRKKNKTLESRLKQADKRIGEFEESIEEIKSCCSSGIEDVNHEVIKTKNVACDLRKRIDALSKSMYGKELPIDDQTTNEYLLKNHAIISSENYKVLKSHLEKSCNEMFENFNAKFGAVCQLMSTRINPLESLLGIFHKNMTARKKLKTQVQDISRKLMYIESRACTSYACHVQFDDTPLLSDFILSTFSSVREHNGHHFNRRQHSAL